MLILGHRSGRPLLDGWSACTGASSFSSASGDRASERRRRAGATRSVDLLGLDPAARFAGRREPRRCCCWRSSWCWRHRPGPIRQRPRGWWWVLACCPNGAGPGLLGTWPLRSRRAWLRPPRATHRVPLSVPMLLASTQVTKVSAWGHYLRWLLLLVSWTSCSRGRSAECRPFRRRALTRKRMWLDLAAGCLVAALVAACWSSERNMGDLARIMFVHVPRLVAYLAFGITLSEHRLPGHQAHEVGSPGSASAEIGVYFNGLTIALGMIWGKSTWGSGGPGRPLCSLRSCSSSTWVTWACGGIADRCRARRSAWLGCWGGADTHRALLGGLVAGLHQPPSIIRPAHPDGHEFRIALMVALTPSPWCMPPSCAVTWRTPCRGSAGGSPGFRGGRGCRAAITAAVREVD